MSIERHAGEGRLTALYVQLSDTDDGGACCRYGYRYRLDEGEMDVVAEGLKVVVHGSCLGG